MARNEPFSRAQFKEEKGNKTWCRSKAPVDALTSVIELSFAFGTQMSAPDEASTSGW